MDLCNKPVVSSARPVSSHVFIFRSVKIKTLKKGVWVGGMIGVVWKYLIFSRTTHTSCTENSELMSGCRLYKNFGAQGRFPPIHRNFVLFFSVVCCSRCWLCAGVDYAWENTVCHTSGQRSQNSLRIGTCSEILGWSAHTHTHTEHTKGAVGTRHS